MDLDGPFCDVHKHQNETQSENPYFLTIIVIIIIILTLILLIPSPPPPQQNYRTGYPHMSTSSNKLKTGVKMGWGKK